MKGLHLSNREQAGRTDKRVIAAVYCARLPHDPDNYLILNESKSSMRDFKCNRDMSDTNS
jgi:hypothetical protein